MTDQTTGNRKIAVFMGELISTDDHTGGAETICKAGVIHIIDKSLDKYDEFAELSYHTSWDWLMPVIAKISDMVPPVKMPEDIEKFRLGTHPSEPYMDVVALPISTPIQEVYEAVVKFIEWHEKNHA